MYGVERHYAIRIKTSVAIDQSRAFQVSAGHNVMFHNAIWCLQFLSWWSVGAYFVENDPSLLFFISVCLVLPRVLKVSWSPGVPFTTITGLRLKQTSIELGYDTTYLPSDLSPFGVRRRGKDGEQAAGEADTLESNVADVPRWQGVNGVSFNVTQVLVTKVLLQLVGQGLF